MTTEKWCPKCWGSVKTLWRGQKVCRDCGYQGEWIDAPMVERVDGVYQLVEKGQTV